MSVQPNPDLADGPAGSPANGAPVWRQGGAGDAELAARLAGKAFDPFYREAWSGPQIRGLLETSDSWLDLGATTEAVIAFALCRRAVDEVELLLCATAPGWRRRGVGTALMRTVIDSARSKNARRLFLEVRATNEAALALYRRAGLAESGRRKGYYHTLAGDPIDAITLSMQI